MKLEDLNGQIEFKNDKGYVVILTFRDGSFSLIGTVDPELREDVVHRLVGYCSLIARMEREAELPGPD